MTLNKHCLVSLAKEAVDLAHAGVDELSQDDRLEAELRGLSPEDLDCLQWFVRGAGYQRRLMTSRPTPPDRARPASSTGGRVHLPVWLLVIAAVAAGAVAPFVVGYIGALK